VDFVVQLEGDLLHGIFPPQRVGILFFESLAFILFDI
jgi:hypothetical protein